MLNYRLISINLDIIVSATIWYVFIRIHVESFNVVYEPCHGETHLRHYTTRQRSYVGPTAHCIVGSGFACCLVKHMAQVVL